MGVGKKLFNIIKHQYDDTGSSIKYKNMVTDMFNITRGVKQGDSLSPTLFNIFINDITEVFDNDLCYPLKIIDSKLSCLLFADDLLIFSETKTGLQNSLNNLALYCDKWQIELNIKKTKSMIFNRTCSKLEKIIFKF